ncbi:MAG: cytochrome oxidase subunit [Bacilli bacterium]|jgi:cytochrome c oxidase subunit 4|nr:cytochrome oxidase subunit [Bacilli bacterium]
MSAEHHSEQHASLPLKRHKVEGPSKHYLAYIVSILLTMLSFAIVIYGGLDRSFLLIFLVSLAIVQAIFQLYVWMHAKERGHFFPILFLSTGAFVAVSAAIAAVYWLWW